MAIRQLEERDLARITEIAHHGLEYDEVNLPVIREKTTGAHDRVPELGIVFERDGKVLGFAQGAMGKVVDGKQKGYIRLLVVDPAHRNAGVGGALLKELETRLKSKGVVLISTFDVPQNYFMPGVDFRYTEAYCFLQRNGYTYFRENHNLICDISVSSWPDLDAQAAALAREGVEIRRAHHGDEHAVFKLIEENWPAWHDEVAGAIANDPMSLYIANHEGRTIAFSGYQGNNKSLNWFGPMGTLPVLRGKGIGGILLRLCLRDLARQGWRKAIIPWVGPVHFYSKMCGARLDRCFWVWHKEM